MRWGVVALLLVTFAASSWAQPFPQEGPAIGVYLFGGLASSATERVEFTVSTYGGFPLWVELATGGEWLEGGEHQLALAPGGATIGSVTTKQPFRLRAGGTPEVGKRNRLLTGIDSGSKHGVYEGWFEVIPGDDGWMIVNRLPLERYLLRVVDHEVPAFFHPVAQEAQAIASRTYALYQILARPGNAPFHVRATVSSQVYGNEVARDSVLAAVSNTRGQVLFFDGKVFEAFFHSTCGGATFRGASYFGVADIEPFDEVLCDYCQPSRVYRWKDVRVAEERVRRLLNPLCQQHGIRLGQLLSIDGVDRGLGEHSSYVKITHSNGSFEMDAARFRLGLKLKSTAFWCQKDGDEFVFHGRGWGHGVGMCQFGVNGLAETNNYDAVGILQYYFKGAKVMELWR